MPRMCFVGKCKKRGYYNFTNNTTGYNYCPEHREDGMKNLVSKRCRHTDCYSQPRFNFEDQTSPIYCKDHKLDGMIDVGSPRCLHEECRSRPVFNIPSEKSGIYCGIHKKDGMIDVKTKKCIGENCTKHPLFNFEGQSPRFCKDHRENGMVDVKSKRCAEIGCDSIQPPFNYPEHKQGLYCKDHKKDLMENVLVSRCHHVGCKKTSPGYGFLKRTHCFLHREEGMVNFTLKECSNCHLKYRRMYDTLCNTCHPERSKLRHKKEEIVKKFLDVNVRFKYIHDKSSPDIKTCTGSYIRPDFVFSLVDKIIIVEVDENQHQSYPEECESMRMINLCTSFGGMPVVFLRYNPDTFRIAGKIQRVDGYRRLKKLKNILEEYIAKPLDKLLTVEYLFYSDDRERTQREYTEFLMASYI